MINTRAVDTHRYLFRNRQVRALYFIVPFHCICSVVLYVNIFVCLNFLKFITLSYFSATKQIHINFWFIPRNVKALHVNIFPFDYYNQQVTRNIRFDNYQDSKLFLEVHLFLDELGWCGGWGCFCCLIKGHFPDTSAWACPCLSLVREELYLSSVKREKDMWEK